MQSYLQYRRLGAELKSSHSHDEEHFHRQHSTLSHDRTTLYKTLTSGHSRHAALGDLFYLIGSSPGEQQNRSKDHHDSTDSEKTQVDNSDVSLATDGIKVRDRTAKEGGEGSQVFVVNFTHDDPNNPRNWKTSRRIVCVVMVAMIGFLTLASSAIDSAVAPEAAKAFHVSLVVESLATGKHRPSSLHDLANPDICRHMVDWFCTGFHGCRTFLRDVWQKSCLHW